MIYRLNIGPNNDPELDVGNRWFARQIESRFGLGDTTLPVDWVLLLREMDRELSSEMAQAGLSKKPSDA